MAAIVGVHGIMKQQLGRHLLIAAWAPALADGIERAAGRRVGAPGLEVAFYGDLFLPSPGGGGKGPSSGDAADAELDELPDDEVEALTAVVEEVVGADSPGDDAKAPAVGGDKGYTRSPTPLQLLLRGLDRVFGSRTASWLFLGEVRQVRRYLLDPAVKAETDRRTAEAMDAGAGPSAQVLIGHSLGSVVAFEYVRQNPDRPVELLLTMGSPLGLRTVQALLPDPTFATESKPANVAGWVNLRDRHDPVACAGDLSRWWPGVEDDDTITNQGDAHAAERYLAKRQTGDAVVRALPHLAERLQP